MQNNEIDLTTHDEYLLTRKQAAELCKMSYSKFSSLVSDGYRGILKPARQEGKAHLYKRRDVLDFLEYTKKHPPMWRTKEPKRDNFKNVTPSNKLLDQLLRTKKLLHDEILKQQKAFDEICRVINSLAK